MLHWRKNAVQMAFWGFKVLNFNINTIKNLEIPFSDNEQLAENMNFEEIVNKYKNYLEFELRLSPAELCHYVFQNTSIVKNCVCN